MNPEEAEITRRKTAAHSRNTSDTSSVLLIMPQDGTTTTGPHSSQHPAAASSPQSPLKKWGTRHTLTLLGFLGFASSYSMRVNLSIAIVKMVNNTGGRHHHHHHIGHVHGGSNASAAVACPELMMTSSDATESESFVTSQGSSSLQYPTFNWTSQEQGILLGSFFYGYVVTQIPGGLLANKIGGKWVFGVGMLITAVFSLVTPLAAEAGLGYLIAVRVIQGLGEGVTNPSMHALLAQWVPSSERSMLGAFVYAGTQIGTVIALPLSGWLLGNQSDSVLTSGWPSVFYVFGLLGIVWFGFWGWFVYDSPNVHPRISIEELQFIQYQQQQESLLGDNNRGKNLPKRGPTPWRSILTSGPVLAILVAQTGHGWGLYTLLTELPSFMDDVLHFDIKQNANLSGLPYLLMWIVGIVSSVYADKMRASGVGTGTVRKLFNTIAHWLPGLLLILASHSACNRSLTVTLITLAISFNGAAYASLQVNHIDLSPNNAAVLMGITNGFANLCGIGAPYVAGVIIDGESSVSRWRIIFYIAAIVYFIDNCVYLVLASGEIQPWDKFQYNERVLVGRAANLQDPSVINRSSGSSSREYEDDEYHDNNDDMSPLLEP